jgi:hypothetical protein
MKAKYRCAAFAVTVVGCAAAFGQSEPTLPQQVLGPDLPLTLTDNNFLGTAVAVSGEVALVGGPVSRSGGAPAGAPPGDVHEFVRDQSGSWVRGDTLVGEATDEAFGATIALEGDRALIGGLSKAYYFVRVGGHWKLRQELTPGQANSSGGTRVTALALDDCYAAIGTNVQVNGDTRIDGIVQMFDACGRDRTQAMKQGQLALLQTLTDTNAPDESSFGASLSLRDHALLVGEPNIAGGGAVHLFELRGRYWIDVQTLVSAGPQAGGSFGSSVALGDDLILIGAPNANCCANGGSAGDLYEGLAYTFVKTRRGWAERQILQPAQTASWGGFGTSVAIGRDTLAVGAPAFIEPRGGPGSVFLLTLQGRDYNFTETLNGPQAPYVGSAFGSTVVISRDTLLVGAPFAVYASIETGVVTTGEADVYDLSALIPQHRTH